MRFPAETRGRRILRRLRLSLLWLLAGLLPALAAFFVWQHFYPAQIASGWQFQVLHGDVRKASVMLAEADGTLLVAEELRKRQGTILKIAPDGHRSVWVLGLDKPDGLVPFQGGLAYSQEGGAYPVFWVRDGQVRALFEGQRVQGLLAEGPYLYAIEDRKRGGRILRYDHRSAALEVLRSSLQESESLVRCPDGRYFYTEKAAGRVRELLMDNPPGTIDPVQVQGLREPGYLTCDDRGLWISEDRTHRARLLLREPSGRLKTLMTFLRAPQMLLPLADGSYLLAEGGRDRVLRLLPPDEG